MSAWYCIDIVRGNFLLGHLWAFKGWLTYLYLSGWKTSSFGGLLMFENIMKSFSKIMMYRQVLWMCKNRNIIFSSNWIIIAKFWCKWDLLNYTFREQCIQCLWRRVCGKQARKTTRTRKVSVLSNFSFNLQQSKTIGGEQVIVTFHGAK